MNFLHYFQCQKMLKNLNEFNLKYTKLNSTKTKSNQLYSLKNHLN